MNLQKFHVASGSFVIDKNKPLILQAFLGTCVGVVIVDRVNKIGGMIHILLPEPVSLEDPDYPEKYATTGLPLFIDEFYNSGSHKENMFAYVAGGALVGPVNNQDIALDIGGRTAEKAIEILKNEGIKIEHSETGGFFTCSLNLNMESFDCSVSPIIQYKSEKSDVVFEHPTDEDIETAVENLQPIPQVALKILRLLDEENYNVKDIALEVRKDQVISAKILQLCNSSLFGIRRKIESLDDALIILGLNMLVKIVVTTSVKQYYKQSSSGYSLCKGGLFHHAIGSAYIAEKIAKKIKGIPQGAAFTAGLLHDIGIVILDQYFETATPFFYRELQNHKTILATEKKVFGITHAEAGYKLAKKWNFPDILSDSIKHHHNPESSPSNKVLVNIINIADLLMARFNAGMKFGTVEINEMKSRLNRIGLTMDHLPELVDFIPVQESDYLFE